MKNKIPKQLHSPDYRFFIAGRNKKTPIEKLWNSKNNYMFFEPKLMEYLNNGYNVGVCCGFGNLIVIDFDDADYQKQIEPKLPKTFTVRTAGKGLHHKYYILKGDMISKVGIDTIKPNGYTIMNRNKDGSPNIHRVADIQAGKYGVICPPSKIDRKYYSVIDNSPIAEITKEKLTKIFNLTESKFKSVNNRSYDAKPQPELIQKAMDLFELLEIKRTGERHFKCPFHKMTGNGNLHIFDNASLYCFHCQKSFKTYEHFVIYYYEVFGIK